MKIHMKILLRFVLTFSLPLLACFASAAPPQTINYQGYLTNPGGSPINSSVGITFKLYNAASGGAPLFTEVQPSVAVSSGNFNAVIGAISPITLPFDVPYWLTVTINADPEMSPRQPLASSAYAFRAAALASTATLAGSQLTGSITTATIPVANVVGAVAGPAGPTGPQGPQGQQGPQGVQGTTGLTGAAGSAGAQGPIGATGATGPAGPNNISGNLTMVNSTSTVGNIVKGAAPFLHNFGTDNTFLGLNAGNFSMSGDNNTAAGANALHVNTSGHSNTAYGANALPSNTTGLLNTATGTSALQNNETGAFNTASGGFSLKFNTTGINNTAVGSQSLLSNVSGDSNTALGFGSLQFNETGSGNIALGVGAGAGLVSGTGNIYIGTGAGAATETNTIRIGQSQAAAYMKGINLVSVMGNPVVVSSDGQLGTVGSSRRYKEGIADMETASSALMQLRPVTFHYKTDQNPLGRTLQYGLIAEEVNEIYPGLVVLAHDGRIETVAYQHLPPMLLNEFQKQQRTIAMQATELAQQRARMELLERKLLNIESMINSR